MIQKLKPMFKFISAIFLIFLAQQCNDEVVKQKVINEEITPKSLANLPNKLDESSGLEVVADKIYSMNDSGGKPELFVFDTKGNAQEEIKITTAENHDWESLAANSTHFFIGDFGNNSGNRKDLAVYYFSIQDLNKDKIKADKINFRYANQPNYKQKSRKHSYDGEALIALDEELVIFSKDWAGNTTQVYHLPLNTKGKKEEVISISPSEQMPINALITGADYDATNQRLILSGYQDYHNYIWVFENSTPQKFLSNDYKRLRLIGLLGAQVEGIAFLDKDRILISTEKTKQFDQQMWVIGLDSYIQ